MVVLKDRLDDVWDLIACGLTERDLVMCGLTERDLVADPSGAYTVVVV